MSDAGVQGPGSLSLPFVEEQYESFLRNPASVPPDWRAYFETMHHGEAVGRGAARAQIQAEQATPATVNGDRISPAAAPLTEPQHAADLPTKGLHDLAALQNRVDQMVRNFRVRGHMIAQIDPLGQPRPMWSELDPSYYGFTHDHMDLLFSTRYVHGPDIMPLRKVLQRMGNTYCRYIGAQFTHISDVAVREWLQERMESTENRTELSRREQIRILTRLIDATIFEQFIQMKFIGAKSFSLEGAESLIPLLDLALEKAGEQGIDEIVVAMAHRGRLNVLANIMGKGAHEIFHEFEDQPHEGRAGAGDVKYHLGHSTDWRTRVGKTVHLSLCFNPSHLEFVNPVALGRMRAKQDRTGAATRGERGFVMLIHGDAAFAGEGIVQETLNLSQLPGYTTGGTLHVVVNNQLGFTTDPSEGRSTIYATDVAKMLQIPIFHVNGENPEAVAACVKLAMDFRRQFKRDVVIDMYCYRRRGHNEGDEPSFTQPLLYAAIEKRPGVREGYLEHLLKLGGITREEADRIAKRRQEFFEKELAVARSQDFRARQPVFTGHWGGHLGGPESDSHDIETCLHPDTARDLLEATTHVPEDFNVHPKLARLLDIRREMAAGKKPLDWAAGEALAFASLVTQNVRVRLSGQDVQRGTFSHRHAVLHDVKTGKTYTPLAHLSDNQAPIDLYNSPLSEAGVLGFEYGYSLDTPEGLVIWEAQFGDFWNVAQPIVDQFIVSAEDKWRRLSGLVMLLPHGFEGQGPEHSSARVERFLLAAAQDNIQVVNASTPAQFFHVLRRQVLRRWRKPLVITTPKSLLRHPKCVSPLEAFTQGRFHRVLPDTAADPTKVRRVLLCTGKIYYELLDKREQLKREDVAIVRLEQLYPFPETPLRDALAGYAEDTPAFWVQEEPENMGAWRYMRIKCGMTLFGRMPLSGVYRPESASPATGSMAIHKLEQAQVLTQAFAGV